jgi:type I restriction enzyme S subunit
MVPNGWTHENFQTLKISTVDGDRGKNYPQKIDYHSEGYSLFLGADNVADGKLNLDKCIFLTKEKHESMGKGIAREDDILLVMRGNGTGRSCIYRGEIKSFQARINSGLVIIRHNKEYTNIEFLHQLFQSPLIKKQFEGYMFGSAQPQLTIQLLKSLRLCIPKLEEQEKIAQVLSTWDQAISTTEKLLENSQQQKKALMQQLLTGKKRLLDENGMSFSEEWQSGHLVDIAKISKGKALSSKDLKSGSYPVIAGGKTSPYTHSEYTHENVITVSASGAYAGYVAFYPYKIWASDCSVVSNKIGSDINFIYQLLILMQTIIYSLQSGGAQPHIYPKDIESLKVLIPPLVEQQKIAKFFAVVDQEIDTLQKKLECLRQEKKALMQQLLTGKKRVKVAA